MDTVLVQVRLPRNLVEKLDELVRLGLFSSRSEIVVEAVRRLILEYGRVIKEDVILIEEYICGKKPNVTSSVAKEVDVEEALKKIKEFIDSDKVEDVIRWVRTTNNHEAGG